MSLLLTIGIYIILKSIFNFNLGADIIISTIIYLTLFCLILRHEYKNVKHIKDTYLLNLDSIQDENQNKSKSSVNIIITEDEILTQQKKN